MLATQDFTIELCPAADLERRIAAFAALLHSCVHDGANIGFVVPFSLSDSETFWRDAVLPGLRQGTRHLFAAWDGGRLAGSVQLCAAAMPNQKHRADVAKLLVHPDFRRRGLARILMATLETLARDKGFGLLTLDTLTASPAEPLYASLGFQTAGVIPDYCRDPFEDRVDPTTLMYKILPTD